MWNFFKLEENQQNYLEFFEKICFLEDAISEIFQEIEFTEENSQKILEIQSNPLFLSILSIIKRFEQVSFSSLSNIKHKFSLFLFDKKIIKTKNVVSYLDYEIVKDFTFSSSIDHKPEFLIQILGVIYLSEKRDAEISQKLKQIQVKLPFFLEKPKRELQKRGFSVLRKSIFRKIEFGITQDQEIFHDMDKSISFLTQSFLELKQIKRETEKCFPPSFGVFMEVLTRFRFFFLLSSFFGVVN